MPSNRKDSEVMFGTVSERYDPDDYDTEKYYIGTGTNTTGDGSSVYLSPLEMYFCKTLVSSKRYPYKTVADVVNDAMIHRFHELGLLSEELVEYEGSEWAEGVG